jgi:hypothetical protein
MADGVNLFGEAARIKRIAGQVAGHHLGVWIEVFHADHDVMLTREIGCASHFVAFNLQQALSIREIGLRVNPAWMNDDNASAHAGAEFDAGAHHGAMQIQMVMLHEIDGDRRMNRIIQFVRRADFRHALDARVICAALDCHVQARCA